MLRCGQLQGANKQQRDREDQNMRSTTHECQDDASRHAQREQTNDTELAFFSFLLKNVASAARISVDRMRAASAVAL